MPTTHGRLQGPTVIVVPGLGGSGPDHWQSRWQRTRADTVRAELGRWNEPDRDIWVARLDGAIRASRSPVVLAAHSLGSLAVAWWAARALPGTSEMVASALLVAPPDVEAAAAPAEVRGFAPPPRRALPFSSVLVCSDDDPWIAPPVARELAAAWGSEYVEFRSGGHLNAESGLGDWPDGQRLLDRLIAADVGHPRKAESG